MFFIIIIILLSLIYGLNRQDADELIDQTKKAVDHHRLLTRLKGDAITEKAFSPDSVPSLTREALTFANSVKPLLNFVELPSIVNRFLRLLHDRQKYEKQVILML